MEMRQIIFETLREWDVVGYEDLACVLEHKLRAAGYGEAPALPDGYYWVRVSGKSFVGKRICGRWWVDGGTGFEVTVISDRLKEPE